MSSDASMPSRPRTGMGKIEPAPEAPAAVSAAVPVVPAAEAGRAASSSDPSMATGPLNEGNYDYI